MVDAAEETAAEENTATDDESGQSVAEAWSIEYLKASAVSVDPAALSLLERENCKRLRAIPLAAGSGGALVAVSAPSEERFAAIRELTGEQTRFVLVSDGTLDALLGSRMFADSPATSAAAATPAKEPVPEQTVEKIEEVEETEIDPAAEPAAAARRKRRGGEEQGKEVPEEKEAPPAEEPAASEHEALPANATPPEASAGKDVSSPDASVDNIVGAVLNALKHRVGSEPDSSPVEAPADATATPGSTAELLARLDATIETWSALRTALANVHGEFQETRRALRETKEQLSVAHADNDQYRKRVRTLEGDLAESRERATQARSRLQEAAGLLESDPLEIPESAELL